MKENNLFDEEAQKIAFQQTYNAVMSIISEDVKTYLEEIVGDFDEFITAKMHSARLRKNTANAKIRLCRAA